MPITKELDNLRMFESAGFTHEQAEVLTDAIEQSHVDGQQNLKDFISGLHEDTNRRFAEVNKQFDEIRKEMRTEITGLEWRIKASHADLLMKIFAIVAGCTSIAVAVTKIL